MIQQMFLSESRDGRSSFSFPSPFLSWERARTTIWRFNRAPFSSSRAPRDENISGDSLIDRLDGETIARQGFFVRPFF